jgi:HTH-type transcriptional regulator/antitoxin HigA
MITNEKQFRSTRALAERLRESIVSIEKETQAVHPILAAAQRSALASQLSDLEADIALYQALRSGQITMFKADGLHDLPDILIHARIARGMSQKDLAEFLGLKEQQIQRYEAERYRSASLERLIEIAGALNVKINETGELLGNGQLGKVDAISWSSFPIAEMFKRGYFEDFPGTLSQARKAAGELVPAFLRSVSAQWAPAGLHRKSVRSNGKVHEAAIAAWEARVLSLADRSPPAITFDPTLATAEWLQKLVHLSADPIGPKKAAGHLGDIGIALIVEPHLPGTLLDGAALCTAQRTAIVALTLRHDRLDNFWFTLFHELGHLVLHIGVGKFVAIFDDTDSPASTEIEEQADLFAQDALLPLETWNTCLSRFTRTEKAVQSDAKRFGISSAIIAGRIRRDAGDYTLLRNLIGSGEVRKQFGL